MSSRAPHVGTRCNTIIVARCCELWSKLLYTLVYTFLYLYIWYVIQIDTKYQHQWSTIIPKSCGPVIEAEYVFHSLTGTSRVKNFARSQSHLACSKIQKLNHWPVNNAPLTEWLEWIRTAQNFKVKDDLSINGSSILHSSVDELTKGISPDAVFACDANTWMCNDVLFKQRVHNVPSISTKVALGNRLPNKLDTASHLPTSSVLTN